MDSVTVATGASPSPTVDFTFASGVTTREDELGYEHRFHWSGAVVTKTDMLISGVAKYVTEYRHAGDELVTIVKPRDNRPPTSFGTASTISCHAARRRRIRPAEQHRRHRRILDL